MGREVWGDSAEELQEKIPPHQLEEREAVSWSFLARFDLSSSYCQTQMNTLYRAEDQGGQLSPNGCRYHRYITLPNVFAKADGFVKAHSAYFNFIQ